MAARQSGGTWLIRIEDIDSPREVPGSADQIIGTLAALGFQWNESIVRQSARIGLYERAAQRLIDEGTAFLCSCSRAEIAAGTPAPRTADADELRYPGWCRAGVRHSDRPLAVRFRVSPGVTEFDDEVQGPLAVDVGAEVGDFVVRRRDGLFSYQLAVTVDDATQGITHVVRGADLLRSTPRQILLQRALRLPTPTYAHVPLATDRNGIKLSKSAGAAAIDRQRPGHELWRVLKFLRQDPPPGLRLGNVATLWNWAIEHWAPAPLTGMTAAPVEDSTGGGLNK